MSGTATTPSFPRAPLFAAALAITVAFGVAIAARLEGRPAAPPAAAPLLSRTLNFVDEPNGGVGVIDAATHRAISTLAPGTGFFVRATLRGLANARKRVASGPETPFLLTAWKDGRITLTDPDTGRDIDLEAFGPTNVAAFAALLTTKEAAP